MIIRQFKVSLIILMALASLACGLFEVSLESIPTAGEGEAAAPPPSPTQVAEATAITIPTVTPPPPATPTSPPSPPQEATEPASAAVSLEGGQQFRIDQRASSSKGALENVDLVLYSAEVTDTELVLRLAFENTSDKSFSIIGGLNQRDFVLRDAAGAEYEAASLSENLASISPADGFVPGGANVGQLVFPQPTGPHPYELELLGYDPIRFQLDTPMAGEALAEVAPGDYPIEVNLYSSQQALAPIELHVQSVLVEADKLTFNLEFINTSRQGYDLMIGPRGSEATLLDAEASQYSPLSVSDTFQSSIAPADGWQPGQAHSGSVTFARPDMMQSLRFIFPEYSALALQFGANGAVDAQVTSPTGGEAPPTPTPEAEDMAYETLSGLLAQQAEALQAGDTEAYLATFEPALQEEQQTILERLSQLPLTGYSLELSPAESLSQAESGALDQVQVIVRYTFRDIPEDNPFVHLARYNFTRTGDTWRVSGLEFENTSPLWFTGETTWQESDHFLFFARPADTAELAALANEAETAYNTLAARGLPLESRYVAYFTTTQDDFYNLTGQRSGRLLGAAIFRYDLMEEAIEVTNRAFYLNGDAFVQLQDQLSPNERQMTITHELVHLALAQGTRPFSPPWLTEGAAVYFAGQNNPENRERLVSGGQLDGLSLETLTAAGSLGEHDLLGERVGYEYIYSGETVAYLIETYGEDKFLEFYRAYTAAPAAEVRDRIPSFAVSITMNAALADLSQQLTQEAVQQHFGLTLAELDAAVKSWLKQ